MNILVVQSVPEKKPTIFRLPILLHFVGHTMLLWDITVSFRHAANRRRICPAP